MEDVSAYFDRAFDESKRSRYSALKESNVWPVVRYINWEEWLEAYGSRESDKLAAIHKNAPPSVDRIIVPLPPNLDPACRIELKNKNGGIGFQLSTRMYRMDRRLEAINRDIEQANDIVFEPMQFVDRAVFPGEDDHIRPLIAMPNRWKRVTLAVILSGIIHKQYDWVKKLHGELVHLWRVDHPVWKEWSKKPDVGVIWITAIRRTLPNAYGRWWWIPEVELRFQ